jgi:prepilin-type N-terminal cleavage/methylation domain-containing protein
MGLPLPTLRPSTLAGPAKANGFTLVELMVSLVIGSLVIVAAVVSVVAHIRSSSNLEAAQSINNDLSRITFFLETEVGEGATITYGQSMSPCAAGNSLFTINVPNSGGTGATLASTPIHYFVTGSSPTASLNRCGPPINNNGTLNYGGGSTAVVVNTNTTIQLANSTDPKAITYNLTLWDPSATRSVARNNISNSAKVTLIN